MGYLWFFLAVAAACLLWTATFTAAAARTRAGWLRRLLVVTGLVLPVVSLLPWLAITGQLAFGLRLAANWFAPTVTVAIAAVAGGAWIVRAGLAGRQPAATWPVIGLGAMFVIAKLVAGGTLLFIDNAVVAEARAAQAEAAAVMLANVPPMPADDDNAAVLYRRIFAELDADRLEDAAAVQERLADDPLAADTPAAADILARLAPTLRLIRQAADRPICRFTRDWTRPSIDMLLPEIHGLRQAARLLSLAARRAADEGRPKEAIADVVRLRRMARHAANEPLLISGLVGLALDALADDTLVAILPTLRPGDAAKLDTVGLTGEPFDAARWLLGEQAFGLAMFGGLATGAVPPADLFGETDVVAAETGPPWDPGLGFGLPYRVFLLPADLAGYRHVMNEVTHSLTEADHSWSATKATIEALEAEIRAHPPGIFTRLMMPTFQPVTEALTRAQVRRDATAVLVAATRQRLAAGSLPESLDSLIPASLPAVPRDPFAADRPPLRFTAGSDRLTVYSVGPDGEDDGGPRAAADGDDKASDDVGYSMAIR